jgi:hypothetical protein
MSVMMVSGDAYGRWLMACVERRSGAFTPSTALWESYQAWAGAEHELIGTARALGDAMRARGFAPLKVGGSRGFQGLQLAARELRGRR